MFESKEDLIVIACAAAIILMTLFPPQIDIYQGTRGMTYYTLVYRFIGSGSSNIKSTEIAIVRLALQWIAVLVLGASGIYWVRSRSGE